MKRALIHPLLDVLLGLAFCAGLIFGLLVMLVWISPKREPLPSVEVEISNPPSRPVIAETR